MDAIPRLEVVGSKVKGKRREAPPYNDLEKPPLTSPHDWPNVVDQPMNARGLDQFPQMFGPYYDYDNQSEMPSIMPWRRKGREPCNRCVCYLGLGVLLMLLAGAVVTIGFLVANNDSDNQSTGQSGSQQLSSDQLLQLLADGGFTVGRIPDTGQGAPPAVAISPPTSPSAPPTTTTSKPPTTLPPPAAVATLTPPSPTPQPPLPTIPLPSPSIPPPPPPPTTLPSLPTPQPPLTIVTTAPPQPTLAPPLPTPAPSLPTVAPPLPTPAPPPPTVAPSLPTPAPQLPTVAPPLPTAAPPLPTEAPPLPTTAPPLPTAAPPLPTTAPPLPTAAPPLPTVAPPLSTPPPPLTTAAPLLTTAAPPLPTPAPPLPTAAPPLPTTAPPLPTTAPPLPTAAPPLPTPAPPLPTPAPPVAPPLPTAAPPLPTAAPPLPTAAPPLPTAAPPTPATSQTLPQPTPSPVATTPIVTTTPAPQTTDTASELQILIRPLPLAGSGVVACAYTNPDPPPLLILFKVESPETLIPVAVFRRDTPPLVDPNLDPARYVANQDVSRATKLFALRISAIECGDAQGYSCVIPATAERPLPIQVAEGSAELTLPPQVQRTTAIVPDQIIAGVDTTIVCSSVEFIQHNVSWEVSPTPGAEFIPFTFPTEQLVREQIVNLPEQFNCGIYRSNNVVSMTFDTRFNNVRVRCVSSSTGFTSDPVTLNVVESP